MIGSEKNSFEKKNAGTLSLTFNQLQGSIPSEIGLLGRLRDRIDLSYSFLTGYIPSEIGNLQEMSKYIVYFHP